MSLERDFTETEVKQMDQTIIDLSMQSDDTERRNSLKELFELELAKPNGYPDRFMKLFDSMLTVVGGRVQVEARQRAALGENQEKDPDGQTQDEKQLWALVDMMVQSKTIAKKAKGELGNGGRFN